jgi:UPF0271 protein
MNKKKENRIYILDTSAILSGKPLNFIDAEMITTFSMSSELKPGGKDYQIFSYLKDKGLKFQIPSQESIDFIKKTSKKTGDSRRISQVDLEILALAFDLHKEGFNCIILSDDYSIQNIASELKLNFQGISQKGITKKLKWSVRCIGCGKKFKEDISLCPICGSNTKNIVVHGKEI